MQLTIQSKQLGMRDDRIKDLQVMVQELTKQKNAMNRGMVLVPNTGTTLVNVGETNSLLLQQNAAAALLSGGRIAKPLRGGVPPTPSTPSKTNLSSPSSVANSPSSIP